MKVVSGIDVGKKSLEVSVSNGPVRSFDNTAEGHRGAVAMGREQWRDRSGV